jgi:transcriptional regulator of acetoin/glycerol metabolism
MANKGGNMNQCQDVLHLKEIQSVINETHQGDRDKEILDSWRRCVTVHALNPIEQRSAYILPEENLREHVEEAEDLMRTARFGLETLYQEIVGDNYVVLLTNSQGVTLDYLCDPDKKNDFQKVGLYLGAEWTEEKVGTNGIGACIYTGKPITVHKTDHFHASHISLTCTAAPIYDPLGNLTAVLDVSALQAPIAKHSQSFAQQLVSIWASRIEMAALINNYKSEWLVTFSKSSVFLEIAPDYAISLNSSGRISGMTSKAMALLNPKREGRHGNEILNDLLTDYFEVVMEELPMMNRNTPVNKRLVRLHNGETYFISVTQTKQPVRNTLGDMPYRAYGVLHGGDKQMENIARKLDKLVEAEVNILLQGETGTGKEFLAKYIHGMRRVPGPFIAINCAAIPENLIESELFGYENGAFTGAQAKGKIGLIEQANGGILFLDEIGDMPLNLQARLLRVLAEKEVMRIGSSKTKHIDIRVICASHRNLKNLVEGGEFREDLYYRVAGITFTMPSLRDREDLKWLINRILAKKHKGQKESVTTISEEAEQALILYEWPGNIRQLENILELAKILGEGQIDLGDLPEEIQSGSSSDPGTSKTSGMTTELYSETISLYELLEEMNWNISAVSKRMGCDRKTIYRHMKKAGISAKRLSQQWTETFG